MTWENLLILEKMFIKCSNYICIFFLCRSEEAVRAGRRGKRVAPVIG